MGASSYTSEWQCHKCHNHAPSFCSLLPRAATASASCLATSCSPSSAACSTTRALQAVWGWGNENRLNMVLQWLTAIDGGWNHPTLMAHFNESTSACDRVAARACTKEAATARRAAAVGVQIGNLVAWRCSSFFYHKTGPTSHLQLLLGLRQLQHCLLVRLLRPLPVGQCCSMACKAMPSDGAEAQCSYKAGSGKLLRSGPKSR